MADRMKVEAVALSNQDVRRLTEAEGYLELDLPVRALAVLRETGLGAGETYEWHALMAEALRALEKHAEAIPLLEEALRIRPESVAIHINLGWCLKRTGRLHQAVAVLHRAETICRKTKDSDSHALVMYNLSCYYSLLGSKDEMLEWLSWALDLCPAYQKLIAGEKDFEPFRHDADFRKLIESVERVGVSASGMEEV